MSKRLAPQVYQRQRLVEEYASLDRELDLWRPKQQRLEKLREIILGWHTELAAEEQITIPGQTIDLMISARDKMRTVTPAGRQKLYRTWGPKQYIERSVVYLKMLPDPRDEAKLYTEEALTGPRHLHVIPRSVQTNKEAAPAA